ncbi:MAG: sulfurtransferase complex subunit TusB [Woeseiaceae bacterium]
MNKSPFEKNSLDTCLRLAKRGSVILLIEDAVYAAMKGTTVAEKVKQATQQHRVYALGPDLRARGLDETQVIDDIKIIGYDGFVDLAVENDGVQSWL